MDHAEALAILQEVKRRATVAERKAKGWSPHEPTPKQQEFLRLTVREALYGGAAGGGKSDALLMGALEYIEHSTFAALILRRTYADLSLPGAIMDRAKDWLRSTEARWNQETKTWTFPSGATVTFGYLESEDDKYRYQSSEFNYIAFDELTQFTETQYTYLLSRLRRLKGSEIPSKQRAGSNPGGRGHEWVKRRFVDDATRNGRVFVPSTLDDNPHIDAADYEESLSGLDSTTYEQLRKGRWILDRQGLIYKYLPDRNAIPGMPDTYPVDPGERRDAGWRHGIAIDFGTREDKPTTAIGVFAFRLYDDQRLYLVESEKKADQTPSSIAERVQELDESYGGFDFVVGDQGGLGNGYINEMRRRFAIPITGVQKSDKAGFRKLMNGDLEGGRVVVVEHGNADLIGEWNELRWNEKGTDNEPGADNHASDMALYGWRHARHWLSKHREQEPTKGTDEHSQWQAQKIKAARAQKLKQKASTPWWAKR